MSPYMSNTSSSLSCHKLHIYGFLRHALGVWHENDDMDMEMDMEWSRRSIKMSLKKARHVSVAEEIHHYVVHEHE